MSAIPFSSFFASIFGGSTPSMIDDSGADRAARAQKRRSLRENMARFPAPAAQMSFRRQLAELDAQDRAEIGAFGAAKYASIKSVAKSGISYSPSTSTSLRSAGEGRTGTGYKSSPSSSESSAEVSDDPDLMTADISIEDYPAQLDTLRAKLRKEKNAARRQRIQTKIQQLLRAQRRATSQRPASRRASGSAATPRVTTEELREKLETLIGRKVKLGEKFRAAKGGKRSDLQQRIQGLNKKIEEIKARIDRLDTLPPARKGAEVRAISTSLNDASTLARTLEADPSLRYGAEDIPDDEGGSLPRKKNKKTDDEADEADATPVPSAALDITADQPWYRRHAVPLTVVGAGVAIMATLYFTRSGKSRD